MKIAILGTRGIPSGYSGYETFAMEVGPRLVERGHEVLVYCRRSLFKERPPTYRGIQLVYLPSIQTKSLSTFSHTCLSAFDLAFRRADVALFVNVANSPFCAVTKMAGIKTALNVDGLEWLRPKWGRMGKKYFHTAARICKYTTHKVITDAPRMQEIYRQEFGVTSVDIAYGANTCVPTHPERIKNLGLEPGRYFFTACRLIPDNHVDLLVNAFAGTETDLKYVVVGDTPYPSQYVQEVRACNDPRIVFLGHVDDQTVMDELYANAYAYLHAHEYGGTNPTLLRALAAGAAVLALDTPFNRHVMREAGRFFTEDVNSARAQIQFAADHPETVAEWAEAGPRRIAEEYTWDIITDQYVELCTELSNQR